MFDRLQICLQHYLPKQLLTRLAGRVANCQLPWLSQTLIKLFIRYYQVDMQQSAVECKDFRHFNDFFTRPLKADARIIDAQADSIVCPADGLISQCGAIEADQLLQAKGHHYSSLALLAGDYQLAEQFSQGQFVTTYLSPRDYHRVHMPCQGTLREMIYVPGDLFSVNLLTAQHVENLFARNERVICLFDTPLGPMAQILVGATIVGSIETVWAGCITPPRPGIIQRYRYPASGEQAIVLAKGQEMGRFKLGSTVINLFAANSITLQLAADQRVNYGQMLAMINH